jgi:hypothetical protein
MGTIRHELSTVRHEVGTVRYEITGYWEPSAMN